MAILFIIMLIFCFLSKVSVLAYSIPTHPGRSVAVHDDWVPVSLEIKSSSHVRNGEPLLLSFQGYEQHFHLELFINEDLISPTAEFYIGEESVFVSRNNFYHGILLGFADSRACMFINDDEEVSGIIRLANGTIYVIDLVDNVHLHEQPPDDTRQVILRFRNASEKFAKSRLTKGPTDDSKSKAKDEIYSRRDTGLISPEHVVCDLYLDSDSTFYQQWGGEIGSTIDRSRRTLEKMISFINEVNGIYESNFDFFQLNIAGAEIHHMEDLVIPGVVDLTQVSSEYSFWLPKKQRKGLQYDEVCLNYLFVHKDIVNTHGVAAKGEIDGRGGVCDTDTYNDPPEAGNIGVITTYTSGEVGDFVITVATIAHEIGHSIGANHDCCSNSDKNPDEPPTPENCKNLYFCHSGCDASIYGERYCDQLTINEHECVVGSDPDDHFLMYPLSNGRNVHQASQGIGNALTFSSCSIRQIRTVLKMNGKCLRLPKTKEDPCLDCKDPVLCACCSNGSLRPSSYKCRQDLYHDCLEESSFCNGKNTFCPGNSNKPDGGYCDNTDTGMKGICYNGECNIPQAPICASVPAKVMLKPCAHMMYPCMATCFVPFGATDICSSLSEACDNLIYIDMFKSCPFLPELSPCGIGIRQGVCKDYKCIPCYGDDCPWNRNSTSSHKHNE